MIKKFYSNGKLLITGEYVVLDGALALAVPTKSGQSLVVENREDGLISWTALNYEGEDWFKLKLKFTAGMFETYGETSASPEIIENLKQILTEADKLNPELLIRTSSLQVTTKLDFPQNWGLGSSSTLINNIAQWFGIDAYKLLENTIGGSGYDIAAAQYDHPLTFQRNTTNTSVLVTAFDPPFKDRLFFVHLNQKQNSRDSIAHYRKQPKDLLAETIEKVSSVTQSIVSCASLEEFELLINIHETLISKIIDKPKIKTTLFPNYPGAVKSLGGWGGDFILATGSEPQKEYFRNRGFGTILSYEEMVK